MVLVSCRIGVVLKHLPSTADGSQMVFLFPQGTPKCDLGAKRTVAQEFLSELTAETFCLPGKIKVV